MLAFDPLDDKIYFKLQQPFLLFSSELECPKPSDLANGYMDCDLPTYLYQSVCSVRCNDGFALQGPMFIQCQANKTWKYLGDQSCKGIVIK